MSLSYTTISGFLLMVAKALDTYGINSEEALAKCDIDPQIIKDPDIRVPIENVGQLLQLAVSETADPAIGLKAGTFLAPLPFTPSPCPCGFPPASKMPLTGWCGTSTC